ncbi:MAG: caspase family protein [Propionibacteriaceae bacterium]|nr:caspase family protein [Propionibacteriaceae bacterium]
MPVDSVEVSTSGMRVLRDVGPVHSRSELNAAMSSVALLVGFSEYDNLTSFPQITSNLSALGNALKTSLEAPSGLDVQEVCDLGGSDQLIQAIIDHASRARDFFLFYYSGHGRRSPHGLTLCLPHHSAEATRYSGAQYDTIRNIIKNSPARQKVVILDCCYSGSATVGSLGESGTDSRAIPQSFVLTSSPDNEPSYVLAGEEFTAFTGRLLRVWREAEVEITLADLVQRLQFVMKQDGLPLPESMDGNNLGEDVRLLPLTTPGPDQKRDAPLIITDGIEVKERLRSEILNRRSVDIFGVAPPVLCAVIREEAPRLHDHVLRYFTLRNRPSLDSGAALGPLTQSWSQALKTITAYAGHHRHLEVLGYEDNYTECLIRFNQENGSSGHHVSLIGLSSLPSTAMPNDVLLWQRSGISDALDECLCALETKARPMALREVLCEAFPAGEHSRFTPGDFPPFRIERFALPEPLGHPQAKNAMDGGLVPISIVCVRGESSRGQLLYVKVRRADDSDPLRTSLLSQQVLEEDVALAYLPSWEPNLGSSDPVDDLWVQAKCPAPFTVPLDSFIRAAQREVYISCGLDVPKHRLRYLGFQVFDDHDHFRQLGFAVFDLCLLRGDHVDETKWIHDRKGTTVIPFRLDELFGRNRDLNRILAQGRSWLQENILDQRCPNG